MVFVLFMLFAFSALVIGIVFYNGKSNPSSGPILDLICKNKINKAKSDLQKKYNKTLHLQKIYSL